MGLHNLKPAHGSTHSQKRVGRGHGTGQGTQAGRGHKGQKSRAGGFHKVGFEGGQMPMQRRLPKRGFISRSRKNIAEIRLSALGRVTGDDVDILVLKEAGIVPHSALTAKVILSGKIERVVKLKGIAVTKGAKAAIEAAGGSVE